MQECVFEDVLPPYVWHFVPSSASRAACVPPLVVQGGTHGDEQVGIELVKWLMAHMGHTMCTPSGVYEHPALRGDLFVVLANPEAVQQNVRGVDADQGDLNRVFLDELLAPDYAGPMWEDLRRAREIRPFLEWLGARGAVILDVHCTISDAPVPFIWAESVDERHRELFPLIAVDRIVWDAQGLLFTELRPDNGQRCAVISHAIRHGAVAFGIESGKYDDHTRLPAMIRTVHDVAIHLGTVVDGFFSGAPLSAPRKDRAQTFYYVKDCVRFAHDAFTYVGGDPHNFQEVMEGEVIGLYSDGTQLCAPLTGAMIFPTGTHRVRQGRMQAFYAVMESR